MIWTPDWLRVFEKRWLWGQPQVLAFPLATNHDYVVKLIRYNVQVFFLINQTDASCCNYHPSFSISRPLTPIRRHRQSLQAVQAPPAWLSALIHHPSHPSCLIPHPGPSHAFLRRTPFPAPGGGMPLARVHWWGRDRAVLQCLPASRPTSMGASARWEVGTGPQGGGQGYSGHILG